MARSKSTLLGAGLLALVAMSAAAQDPRCVDFSATLQISSRLTLPAGAAADVVAYGDAAYVAVAASGVTVVNWADPEAPAVVTHLAVAGGVRDLALGQGALYVIDGAGQLWTYDLADPFAPLAAGDVAPFSPAQTLAISGSRAYLVLAAGGLQNVDLASPLAPVMGGHVALDAGSREAAVDGDLVYVVGKGQATGYYGAFHVLDVSDLANPVLLGSYISDHGIGYGGYYEDVCIGDTGVHVSYRYSWYDWEGEYSHVDHDLCRFEVVDPAHPQPAYDCVIASTNRLMAISLGDRFAAVLHEAGPLSDHCPDCSWNRYALVVKDATASLGDPALASLTLPAAPGDLFAIGEHLLVADGTAGLLIVDAAFLQPGDEGPDPLAVAPYEVRGEGAALSPDGRFLATMWTHEGGCSMGDIDYTLAHLFDLTQGLPPTALSDAWHGMVLQAPSLLFVDDQYLYVGSDIYDIGEGELVGVSSIPASGPVVRHLGLAQGWLVGWDGNVRTWNIGDPAQPVMTGQYALGGVNDLAIGGDRIYAATATRLEILRVDAAGALSSTGFLAVTGAQSVAVNGERLAVGTTAGGLMFYDRTDPDHPLLLGQLAFGAPVNDIALAERAYVALGNQGWAVVRAGDGSNPLVEGRIEGADATQVHVAGDVLALVNDCPVQVRLTGRACPEVVSAAPAPGLPTASGVRIAAIWPNPANPRVTVAFNLAREGRLRADVFDLVGRHVAGLADEQAAVGARQLTWDGCDDTGRPAATGTYLLRLQLDGESTARKLALVR